MIIYLLRLSAINAEAEECTLCWRIVRGGAACGCCEGCCGGLCADTTDELEVHWCWLSWCIVLQEDVLRRGDGREPLPGCALLLGCVSSLDGCWCSLQEFFDKHEVFLCGDNLEIDALEWGCIEAIELKTTARLFSDTNVAVKIAVSCWSILTECGV